MGTRVDSPEAIEQRTDVFVKALRESYLALRRRTRSDSLGLGPRFEPELRRLAGQLMYRGGDPRSYMQFLFDQAAEHGSDTTYPKIMFSADMLNRYFLARSKRREELELLSHLQAGQFESRISNGRQVEEILRDPRVELNAVFRFVVAHLYGLVELEKELREDASTMLDYEPLYREIYRKWLPEELKNERTAAS